MITLSKNTKLIQYVGDLLIVSTDCDFFFLLHTKILLCAITEKGHKVSLAKMQLYQQQANYLGRII